MSEEENSMPMAVKKVTALLGCGSQKHTYGLAM
jgi:hypothetical protein